MAVDRDVSASCDVMIQQSLSLLVKTRKRSYQKDRVSSNQKKKEKQQGKRKEACFFVLSTKSILGEELKKKKTSIPMT